jgi:H+-transporting ATPase
MATNYEEIKSGFEGKILEYAGRGYRALGVGLAKGDSGDNWEFVGLIPIFDPPRHDTKATVEKCIEMGIGVKMITGDQLPIGVETARQLGMGTNMHTTEVFKQAEQSPGGMWLI